MTKTLYPFVGTRFVIEYPSDMEYPSPLPLQRAREKDMDCYVTPYKNCTLTTIIFLTMT